HNVISSISGDSAGGLWIGTHGGGVNRLQNGELSILGVSSGLVSDSVLAQFRDRAGVLWVSTEGAGLHRFQDGRFVPMLATNEAWSSGITAIYEDRQGNLWLGTGRGV